MGNVQIRLLLHINIARIDFAYISEMDLFSQLPAEIAEISKNKKKPENEKREETLLDASNGLSKCCKAKVIDNEGDSICSKCGLICQLIFNRYAGLENYLNRVFNDDCFNIISQLPNECIDLCVVDPSYGTDENFTGYGRSGKKILNDEDESINYRFLEAVYPKLKNNTSLYLFCSHKFFDKIKSFAINKGYIYKMICIYVKNNIGMGGDFRNQHEFCLVLEKGKAEYRRKDMSNVWFAKHIKHDENSHPHQKDYDILRKIILHSSKEGDVVADFFGGSFSTYLCCFRENRNFIGTELDSQWFKLGEQKLKVLMSQKRIFA